MHGDGVGGENGDEDGDRDENGDRGLSGVRDEVRDGYEEGDR